MPIQKEQLSGFEIFLNGLSRHGVEGLAFRPEVIPPKKGHIFTVQSNKFKAHQASYSPDLRLPAYVDFTSELKYLSEGPWEVVYTGHGGTYYFDNLREKRVGISDPYTLTIVEKLMRIDYKQVLVRGFLNPLF